MFVPNETQLRAGIAVVSSVTTTVILTVANRKHLKKVRTAHQQELTDNQSEWFRLGWESSLETLEDGPAQRQQIYNQNAQTASNA